MDKSVFIQHEDGTQTEFEVLFDFVDEASQNVYVVLFQAETEECVAGRVEPSTANLTSGIIHFGLTDEEFDLVEKRFDQFMVEYEQLQAHCDGCESDCSTCSENAEECQCEEDCDCVK